MKIRFDRSTVSDVLHAAALHGRGGDAFTHYGLGAFEIYTGNRRGTTYSGLGAERHTEYGGRGARIAVAYAYGIGTGSGAWERLYDLAHNEDKVYARIALDKIRSATMQARTDLGAGVFEHWALAGRQYAESFTGA